MERRKKGQSILEYVIILTAIVLVIIAAATAVISPSAQETFTQTGEVINYGASKLMAGRGAAGGG